MISFDDYKNFLINYIRSESDFDATKRDIRRRTLDRKYNDSFLWRVRNDSYEFLHDLLNNEEIEKGYYSVPLERDTSIYILLDISGGGASDTIYVTPDSKMVSKYIIKKELGQTFYFEIETKEDTYNPDKDPVETDSEYYLYMSNFPEDVKEIKERIFGKSLTMKDQ